jgi:murein L,D-transpeptidase YafK
MTLSVHGDNGNFRVVYLYKVVSLYAKSILACMKNTLKEYKRIWRIRQEYFRSEFSTKTKNISDPKSPFYTYLNRQKTISRYCPFKWCLD